MKARFDFHGYEMTLSDDGTLSESAGGCGAYSPGHVGFQLTFTTSVPTNTPEDKQPKLLAQFFMAPSHARAVASAMLSAANAAKG